MSSSAASVAVKTAPPSPSSHNARPLAIAVVLIAIGIAYVQVTVGPKQAALAGIGALLGVALYHAAFGFTSAWRVFIADRRGAGLRAQMVMLAVGVVLFFPALADGALFGNKVAGFVSPVGVSVAFGAFLFGIGMQLGGGCASGTLYTVGGGSTRMIVTLAAFVVGSVVATAHMPWWEALPHLKPVSLVKVWGLWPALIANLALFAAIGGLTLWAEKRRHGRVVGVPMTSGGTKGAPALLRGPWPLVWGALALVLLNYATLALAGRPWGVTSAFALWGAKAFMALGIDVASWPYWAKQANVLNAPIAQDVTTVMDIGIILGALAAASIAGKFAPVWKIPVRSLLAAVIGGLLLGYGARLAYGCNIGAYFSGIVSGSLHGWLWLAAAFAGNMVGTRLRPLFGLAVETTPRDTGC
ncbi:YeeE/YedE family protein [Pandoraea terrigena]|uniref:Membrane protein n=1 Tax=Pandoraea terrigena TaxID=2508292 RepID=A0A5E4UZE4_9BURK|nr:YeeE/YedE family protein [Pandoraea terrigena]VVE05316.1 membrane protein [Pandoraea terrigena]